MGAQEEFDKRVAAVQEELAAKRAERANRLEEERERRKAARQSRQSGARIVESAGYVSVYDQIHVGVKRAMDLYHYGPMGADLSLQRKRFLRAPAPLVNGWSILRLHVPYSPRVVGPMYSYQDGGNSIYRTRDITPEVQSSAKGVMLSLGGTLFDYEGRPAEFNERRGFTTVTMGNPRLTELPLSPQKLGEANANRVLQGLVYLVSRFAPPIVPEAGPGMEGA
jgi:hypothetical protein